MAGNKQPTALMPFPSRTAIQGAKPFIHSFKALTGIVFCNTDTLNNFAQIDWVTGIWHTDTSYLLQHSAVCTVTQNYFASRTDAQDHSALTCWTTKHWKATPLLLTDVISDMLVRWFAVLVYEDVIDATLWRNLDHWLTTSLLIGPLDHSLA